MCARHSHENTALCASVAEQPLAFFSEKTAGDRDGVIALLENEPAGDKTRSPLIVLGAALATVSVYVLLRNAVDNRANSRPDDSTGTTGARLGRRATDGGGDVGAIVDGVV